MRGGERGITAPSPALVVPHIPAVDVLGLHAQRRIGLQVDFFNATLVDEVVDVGNCPNVDESVVLTSASERPSADAFCPDRSRCGIAAHRRGHWGAPRSATAPWPRAPSSWLRACISASCPAPLRSCRNMSKPLAVPSSSTAGGAKAKTIASRHLANCAMARPATALTLLWLPLRSSNGLRLHEAPGRRSARRRRTRSRRR